MIYKPSIDLVDLVGQHGFEIECSTDGSRHLVTCPRILVRHRLGKYKPVSEVAGSEPRALEKYARRISGESLVLMLDEGPVDARLDNVDYILGDFGAREKKSLLRQVGSGRVSRRETAFLLKLLLFALMLISGTLHLFTLLGWIQ